MKTLIDHYAHDYRHMNLGEEDIRAMLTEYTREYEHEREIDEAVKAVIRDDVGGMEITEGMRKFVSIVFLALSVALGFIIGLCIGLIIGLWIG